MNEYYVTILHLIVYCRQRNFCDKFEPLLPCGLALVDPLHKVALITVETRKSSYKIQFYYSVQNGPLEGPLNCKTKTFRIILEGKRKS